MIESVHVSGCATFSEVGVTLSGLTTVNFIFGANGSGKTTVTKVISNPDDFSACAVTWAKGTPLQTFVYNRYFVDQNFTQAKDVKGVFTLGKKSIDMGAAIAKAKEEREEIARQIEQKEQTLRGEDGRGGKRQQLAVARATFVDICWEARKRHREHFDEAFAGFRNDKQRFAEKVLEEDRGNSHLPQKLQDLETRAATLLGAAPAQEPLLSDLDATALLAAEADPILMSVVVGKNDVDIAAMIQSLGNSDWVNQGRAYFDKVDPTCPFCQQSTPPRFAANLAAYFDDTYAEQVSRIADLTETYRKHAAEITARLDAILDAPGNRIDVGAFSSGAQALKAIIASNLQRLEIKKREASQKISLSPLRPAVDALKTLVAAANAESTKHNDLIRNHEKERAQLVGQVWRYLLDVDLKAALETYKKNDCDTRKAIVALVSAIQELKAQREEKDGEISALEQEATSVQPTADAINRTLQAFGFSNFRLETAADGTRYRLVRGDGSDAKDTLSEGEKSFVTFLYFYHLIWGSDANAGTTRDRIVVFDDPISSLDSDILFVVAGLVRDVIERTRAGKGPVKQVFVFTHNVYFHREVTFLAKRSKDGALADETFWVMRKRKSISTIDRHKSNPVQSTYDLLWAELRAEAPSATTIRNTMRRILETYFTLLGGVDLKKLVSGFEGEEQAICNALLSWMNAGSHAEFDDLHVSSSDESVDRYLAVFEEIFTKAEHGAHYRMMMRQETCGESAPELAAAESAAAAARF